MAAIYCIKNTTNGKLYVGSAVDVDRRWRVHRNDLQKGVHHSSHLQFAWNKYGEEKFAFLIIEECLVEKLIEKEQFWMDFHDSYNDVSGYNMSPTAGNCLGRCHSEETKKKISESRIGEKHHFFGGHLSEEHRKKISEALTGKITTEETRKKISDALSGEKSCMYGKHHSEETKKKISESEKGRIFSEEHKKRIGESRKGEYHSEESKKKMSGEKHHSSKLTWEKVREIRGKWATGNYSQPQLAIEYGVVKSCISQVVTNRSWKEGDSI